MPEMTNSEFFSTFKNIAKQSVPEAVKFLNEQVTIRHNDNFEETLKALHRSATGSVYQGTTLPAHKMVMEIGEEEQELALPIAAVAVLRSLDI